MRLAPRQPAPRLRRRSSPRRGAPSARAGTQGAPAVRTLCEGLAAALPRGGGRRPPRPRWLRAAAVALAAARGDNSGHVPKPPERGRCRGAGSSPGAAAGLQRRRAIPDAGPWAGGWPCPAVTPCVQGPSLGGHQPNTVSATASNDTHTGSDVSHESCGLKFCDNAPTRNPVGVSFPRVERPRVSRGQGRPPRVHAGTGLRPPCSSVTPRRLVTS